MSSTAHSSSVVFVSDVDMPTPPEDASSAARSEVSVGSRSNDNNRNKKGVKADETEDYAGEDGNENSSSEVIVSDVRAERTTRSKNDSKSKKGVKKKVIDGSTRKQNRQHPEPEDSSVGEEGSNKSSAGLQVTLHNISILKNGGGTYSLALHPWTMFFTDPEIEDMYLVSRCQTIRSCTALAGICFSFSVLLFVMRGLSTGAWMQSWSIAPLVDLTLFGSLGVALIYFCERYPYPPDCLPGGGATQGAASHQDADDSVKSPAHLGEGAAGEEDVHSREKEEEGECVEMQAFRVAQRVALHAEIFSILLFCIGSWWTVMQPYLQDRCLSDGEWYKCYYKLSTYCTLLPVGPLLIHVRCFPVIIWLISYCGITAVVWTVLIETVYTYEPYLVSKVAPWMHWQSIAMWCSVVAVAVVALEKFHRRSFITRLLLLEKEHVVEAHRKSFTETLRVLLPGSAVSKLGAGEVVEDFSEDCTISVCEVKDFNRWSTTQIPQMAMQMVDFLFCRFDLILMRHQTLRKTIMTGDSYIVSAGLREREQHGGDAITVPTADSEESPGDRRPPETTTEDTFRITDIPEPLSAAAARAEGQNSASRQDTLDCFRFAGKQVRFSKVTASLVEGLHLGIGIARGACVGSILGQHYIRYNVSGPAFSEARKLAAAAGDDETVSNLFTVCGITTAGDRGGKELQVDECSDIKCLGATSGTVVCHVTKYPLEPKKPKFAPIPVTTGGQNSDVLVAKEPVNEHKIDDVRKSHNEKSKPLGNETKSQAQRTGGSNVSESSTAFEVGGSGGGGGSDDILDLKAALTTSHAHWWSLHFEDEETEAEYWESIVGSENVHRESRIDLFASCILGLIFYIIPIFEENESLVQVLLVAFALGIATIRFALRNRLPQSWQWVPYWTVLLQNSVFLYSTTFIGTMTRPGILYNSLMPLTFAMSLLLVLANGSITWLHCGPILTLQFFVMCLVMYLDPYYQSVGRMLGEAGPVLPVSAIYAVAIFTREKERRSHFSSTLLSAGATSLLEAKMESYKGLLSRMMPSYVVPDVLNKIKNQSTQCAVQTIPDCVVMALRIDTAAAAVVVAQPSPAIGVHMNDSINSSMNGSMNGSFASSASVASSTQNNSSSASSSFSVKSGGRAHIFDRMRRDVRERATPSETSSETTSLSRMIRAKRVSIEPTPLSQNAESRAAQLIRDQFQAVEQVLHSLKAEEVSCSLIHVLGDTVVVGGPLLNVKAKFEKLVPSAVEMAHWRDLGERIAFEEAAGACATLLVQSLSLLRKTFGPQITASIAYGNGYAAVLGQYLPSFDLLGSACRTAMEVLNASPDGFLGCTESFFAFLQVVAAPQQEKEESRLRAIQQREAVIQKQQMPRGNCGRGMAYTAGSGLGANRDDEAVPKEWISRVGGFEKPTPAATRSWRLRGVGQVQVLPLVPIVATQVVDLMPNFQSLSVESSPASAGASFTPQQTFTPRERSIAE